MNVLKVKQNNQWIDIPAIVGPGVPSGGTAGQVLRKSSEINYDTEWGFITGGLSNVQKSALLACFEKVAWIDEYGQNYYNALYNALYHDIQSVTSISAVYTQSGSIYYTDSLDSLKSNLVVTATYENSDTGIIPSNEYTLSGTLAEGTSTITVTYGNKTATFNVTVTTVQVSYTVTNTLSNCINSNAATSINENASYSGTITASTGYTLSSVTVTMGGTDITSSAYTSGTGVVSIASVTGNIVITASGQLEEPAVVSSLSASFDSNGETLYECIGLDTLKQFLTVTVTGGNSNTETVSAEDYTLSGTLAAGSNTVTVGYDEQTTTFTVTLAALELSAVTLPSGYTQLDYVESNFNQYITLDYDDDGCDAAEYGVMMTAQNNNGKGNHIFSSQATYFPFIKYNNNSISASSQKVLGYNNRSQETLTDALGNTLSTPQYDWALNTKYVFSGYPEIKVNHVTIGFLQAGTGSITKKNFRIFDYGGNNGSTETKYRFSGRLYFLRVYLSGSLTHNYVPCKNSSDVVGLYDTVGDVFVSSATSTALIAGNVVTSGQA